jgi:hypothetical protein
LGQLQQDHEELPENKFANLGKWVFAERNEQLKREAAAGARQAAKLVLLDPNSDSEFSDTESMWLENFSESSQSSNGEMQHVAQSTTEKMTEILYQSPDLQTLYRQATERLPEETFLKHHDDILKSFFELARSKIISKRQLRTVRILRCRSHRQQVNNWIYNLSGPKLSKEALQARKDFLNQRESRDETLERFLKTQINSKEDARVHQAGPDSSDEDEDDDLSLEDLTSMTKFLMSGNSFDVLRACLNSLARPETALAHILHTGNASILKVILSRQFNMVAVGEYEWITELDSAGYTKSEIAQLLADDTSDSPFIFFERHISDTTVDTSNACNVDFHVPDCIHREGNHLAMCKETFLSVG